MLPFRFSWHIHMETLSWQTSTRWQASVAADACLDIGQTAEGIQLDWHLPVGGGFAVARLPLALSVPGRFRLHLRWQGLGTVETLECKLVSAGGGSVWWARQHQLDLAKTSQWQIESHEFEFAWGAAGGGRPGQLSALELAFVGTQPASGKIEILDCWLEDLSAHDRIAIQMSDGSGEATVEGGNLPLPAAGLFLSGPSAVLTLQAQTTRPCTGVLMTWAPDAAPVWLSVDGLTTDGHLLTLLDRREVGNQVQGFYWPLQQLQSILLRVASEAGRPLHLKRMEWLGPEQVDSLEALVSAVANDEPVGRFPAAFHRRQIDWTVVGAPQCPFQALLSLEGRLEARPSGPSLEPFVYDGSRWLTWADGEAVAGWQNGQSPLPQVERRHPNFHLEVAAIAGELGQGGAPAGTSRWGTWVRYRVSPLGGSPNGNPLRGALAVALRPYQVSPPWQHWRKIGGLSPLHSLSWQASEDSSAGDLLAESKLALRTFSPPQIVHLQTWGQTSWMEAPLSPIASNGEAQAGKAPVMTNDTAGLAEAALVWTFDLAPGQTFEQIVFIPFESLPSSAFRAMQPGKIGQPFERARNDWARLVSAWPTCQGPETAEALWLAARTAACHILINRDGAMLQPGPRRYTRSWIRDGVTMAAALLRLGEHQAVADFLDGFTPAIFPSGFVPCCVDRDGVDPLVEHDSHGQWIHLLADYVRFSLDDARLQRYRSVLLRVTDHLCNLIEPETGLIPPSVSHEGYLARPVHALWDDAWALRGLQDAGRLLIQLGEADQASRCLKTATQLSLSLRRAADAVMAERGLRELPGSVEWGDFDPTATACSIGQLGQAGVFETDAVHRTFDRFLTEWQARVEGTRPADRYSAYEIRNAQALTALGRGDEALEQLLYALKTARPPIWQQWPEITWIEPGVPGHLGDLPHTWIAAEFLLAVRSLWLVEESERLIIGRGLPTPWLGQESIAWLNWPTPFGRLSLRSEMESPETLLLSLEGAVNPPGGILLAAQAMAAWTLEAPSESLRVTAEGYHLREAPIQLRWRRRPNPNLMSSS